MYGCGCGRLFKAGQHYEMHKAYCNGPKFCQNPECNILLTGPNQKKYCSIRCSAKMRVKERNFESKCNS